MLTQRTKSRMRPLSLVGEPRTADGIGDHRRRRIEPRPPRWEAGLQHIERPLGVPVARVLREGAVSTNEPIKIDASVDAGNVEPLLKSGGYLRTRVRSCRSFIVSPFISSRLVQTAGSPADGAMSTGRNFSLERQNFPCKNRRDRYTLRVMSIVACQKVKQGIGTETRAPIRNPECFRVAIRLFVSLLARPVALPGVALATRRCSQGDPRRVMAMLAERRQARHGAAGLTQSGHTVPMVSGQCQAACR